MKKILILLSYLCLSLTLIAKDNDKTVLTNKTNVAKTNIVETLPTDPLDLLLQRINNIDKLNPEDFLIDFQSKMVPGDEFHTNIVQFGGTDIYSDVQKTALYAKLNTFNTSQSAVKLFVITGRFMLGYHATKGATADEIANGEKILKAIGNKANSVTPEQTDKKFIKDWISIWDEKRKSLRATNPKVLILFAIEGFFVDKNESLYSLENSGTIAIVDKISDFTKSRAYSLLNYGLPVTDWMKMNQTAVVKLVQNALTGTLDGTKVNNAVDLLTTAWGQPLDLSKFAPLVKTVNGLGDGDVLNVPIAERKQYITKISKSVLYDSQTDNTTAYWQDDIVANRTGDYLVPPIDAKKALNKLLLNTPSAQADAILDQLESEKVGSKNLVRTFLDYQSVAENDAYADYVKATTNLVFSSTTQRAIHLTEDKLFFNNIEFYDNSWTFNQQNIKPIEGTKIYTCKSSDVDNNGNISYSFKITGLSNYYTTPLATGGYTTQHYDSAPIQLHPFDIVTYVDNINPSAAEGIFAVPPPPISVVDRLLNTKFVSALQMRYADDNKAERSFNNLTKTAKSGADIALLFTGAGVASNLRNARYLSALTDFAFSTGSAAALTLQSGTITNLKIRSALESYSKISNYIGFTSILSPLVKGAFLKVAKDIKNIIFTQGETFVGLSRVEAERFRSIFAELDLEYNTLSLSEKEIIDKLRQTDFYLAGRGIKILKIPGNVADDIFNFYLLDRAIQSKNLVEKFNLTQYAQSLLIDEVVAIHRYTVNNFELTQAAYGNGYNTVQKSWVNLINSGLNKLSTTNEIVGTVFRGTNLSLENIQIYVNIWGSTNKTINIPPFLSSSKSKAVAEEFIDFFRSSDKVEVMFEIETKNGIYIDDISDYGKYLQPTRHPTRLIQEEVILRENTSYKIIDLKPLYENNKIVRYEIKMQEL